MPDADLLFTPATAAAALIRRGKLSPVEYVDAVLAAIEVQQPRLNVFVEVMAEEARAEAVKAEAAVRSGGPLGPLHGVPVHIKDLLDVKGVPTRRGSAIFADAPAAAADDVLVARLRAAGAIILGKSTTPEFGNKGLTDSPPHGITRNPWNLGRTSGGSSGGAAAAVAAGLGPLGLGTDGAGSVRGPAACCGVVGLKPTLGSVPYETATDSFANNTYAGPLLPHRHGCGRDACGAERRRREGRVVAEGRGPAAALAEARRRGSFRGPHRLHPALPQPARRGRRHGEHPGRARSLGRDGRGRSRRSPTRSTGSSTRAASSTRPASRSASRSTCRAGRTRWTR